MKQIRRIATLTAIVGALWLGGCEQKAQVRAQTSQVPTYTHQQEITEEHIDNKCHPDCPPANDSLTIDLTSEESPKYRVAPDSRFIGKVIGCLKNPSAIFLFETRSNNYPPDLEGQDLLLYLLTNKVILQETNSIVDRDGDGKVDVAFYGFDTNSKYILPETEVLTRTPEFESFFLAPDEAMYEFREYLRRRK